MKKIAIITPFLANGGLEKVVIVSAEELRKYFKVTLIVMDTFHIDYPYSEKKIDLEVSLIDRNIFKRLSTLIDHYDEYEKKCLMKAKIFSEKNVLDPILSVAELKS